MNIRNMVENKRKDIYGLIDDASYIYYDDDITMEADHSIIDNAIDQFEVDTLRIFGDHYKNEVILEQRLYDVESTNELDIVEEAILDSLEDLKNKVVDAIRNLWNRFKDWMTSIIDSIKNLFSSDSDSSSSTQSTNSDTKSGESKPSSNDGEKESKRSSKVVLKNPNVKKDIDSSYARSFKGDDRRLLEQKYNEKKNSLSLYCHVYRNDTEKMMKMMDDGININGLLQDKKMSADAYYDMLKSKIGGDPRDREGFLKPYIVGMIRDNEKDNHVIGDIPLFIIRGYAFDTADLLNKCKRMMSQYKQLYDTTIASIKNSEKAKRIKYIKNIAMQATKFGTYSIKVFTSEFKNAKKNCRHMVKAIVR